jgi:PIN domain nuclease of toxin-antitoxin system
MPMPNSDDLLILDTHVWIWLMEGSDRLAAPAQRRIEQAVPAEALRVCAISVWEAAMLEAKGRILFNDDCTAWVRRALAAPGLSLFALTPEIAIASTRLPGALHGDPADRLIVATARCCSATLITADLAILAYGKAGHVRTLSASSSA